MRHSYIPALIICILILSCNNNNRYPYAIRDFKKTIQPQLQEIVRDGIVGINNFSSDSLITDQELVQLSKCEHPVLRTEAFPEMLKRESFDHFDIVMNHLDDTAMVLIDQGEFGTVQRRISDEIIKTARWKTYEARDSTIDLVLTKHNYLTAAYDILYTLAPQEKFYPYIKEMATRPRNISSPYDLEIGFDEIEYALYGLAKFRKKEDISLIKKRMMRHAWQLSWVSFALMRKFTDTAWFDVLQSYHRRQFYRFGGHRRGGFTGYEEDRANPEEFINALVLQKTAASARLLDTMLNQLPKQKCMPDQKNIIKHLQLAIWNHPCPAYESLMKKIKPQINRMPNGAQSSYEYNVRLQLTDSMWRPPIDTTEEKIRWW